VLDDRRRRAMSAIRQMGHARTLSDQLLPSDPVAVTMPWDDHAIPLYPKLGSGVVSLTGGFSADTPPGRPSQPPSAARLTS
jgi:hypothetical protein